MSNRLGVPLKTGRVISIKKTWLNFKKEINLALGYKGKERVSFYYKMFEPPSLQYTSHMGSTDSIPPLKPTRAGQCLPQSPWQASCWHVTHTQSIRCTCKPASDTEKRIKWNIHSTRSSSGSRARRGMARGWQCGERVLWSQQCILTKPFLWSDSGWVLAAQVP